MEIPPSQNEGNPKFGPYQTALSQFGTKGGNLNKIWTGTITRVELTNPKRWTASGLGDFCKNWGKNWDLSTI